MIAVIVTITLKRQTEDYLKRFEVPVLNGHCQCCNIR